MKTHRFLRVPLAAMLAIGAIGTGPAPLAPSAVTTPAQQSQDKAPAAAPMVSAALVQRMLGSSAFLVSERKSPIWLGSPKRGARRNRSRWNYRR